MIPVKPSLSVRPLTSADAEPLLALVNPLLEGSFYSAPMGAAELARHCFEAAPPSVYPVRWQKHACLGAWRAGQLVGFIDVATGHDSASMHLAEYEPVGLLRFFAFTERADLAPEVAAALLGEAEAFWRAAGIGYIKAFHISTGYPAFQGGAGILPGDWSDHFRLLAVNGYRMQNRYYCLRRPLSQPIEETVPLADLSLVYRGDVDDRQYQLYYRRSEWLGGARLVRVPLADAAGPYAVAHLTEIEIERRWRGQDIGKWLLRRLINDCTLQGYRDLMVHVMLGQHEAMNLFTQQGFEELNYRGYDLDKALTS